MATLKNKAIDFDVVRPVEYVDLCGIMGVRAVLSMADVPRSPAYEAMVAEAKTRYRAEAESEGPGPGWGDADGRQ